MSSDFRKKTATFPTKMSNEAYSSEQNNPNHNESLNQYMQMVQNNNKDLVSK